MIETPDLRLELRDNVPVGGRDSFDTNVTVGSSVVFAVDKNVAYLRNADGSEYRLRIIKKIPKVKR
jgi:hypothetical protein